jgi:hypothetical protein
MEFKTCSSEELRSIPNFGRWTERFGRNMMKLRYSQQQGRELLTSLWEAGLHNQAMVMMTQKGQMIIALLPENGEQLREINMLIKRVRFKKIMGGLMMEELEQMLMLGHDMLWKAQHGDMHDLWEAEEDDELPF